MGEKFTMKKQIKKSILPLIIFGGIFLGFYLIGMTVPEDVIRNTINDAGSYGIILFILFTWITYVFAPLGGTPFLLAGFYLFGQNVVIYTLIASLIASVTNFWIARNWGRQMVANFTGKENLAKVDKLAQNYGLVSLFFFRVCLGQFHDILSYIFGLTNIKFKSYLLISTIGMIPGSAIMYYFSTKTNNPIYFLIMTMVVAYLFFLVYLLWTKLLKKQ